MTRPDPTRAPRVDRRTALRLAAASLAGLAVVGTASACSTDPNSVEAQAKAGDNKGYISGDGTIERLAVSDRGEAVALSGTTLEGTPWTIADHRDTVVVVNVWGSWCPPCITETPDLQKVWEQVQSDTLPVTFIGLDKQESPATGLAFLQANNVTYPSLAYDGGLPILALKGKATATPTTLVLDRSHRVAARVSGVVTASVLRGLIDDVVAEA